MEAINDCHAPDIDGKTVHGRVVSLSRRVRRSELEPPGYGFVHCYRACSCSILAFSEVFCHWSGRRGAQGIASRYAWKDEMPASPGKRQDWILWARRNIDSVLVVFDLDGTLVDERLRTKKNELVGVAGVL